MPENCNVCGSKIESPSFSALLLGRSVSYFECSNCAYVQTETPYWMEEAYASVINDCDTGLLVRNQISAGMVLGTLSAIGRTQGRIVDCAGGYGILTRLLRDKGVDALWSDPYCQNLVAMGFEHKGESADLVTAFEAFEHFVSPFDEMERLLKIAPNLLISTEIMPTPTPKPDEWWYYGLSHGQHVGFMRVQTLKSLAVTFGKHLLTDGKSYHFFCERPMSMHTWRLHTRLARYFPRLVARHLTSRTWSDFEKMSSME
jgi:Methyltransferase domain